MVKPGPHSLQSEQTVIAAALARPEMVDELGMVLDEDDFHVSRHRVIWTAILRLHDARKPIDVGTLTDALRASESLDLAGGAGAVTELGNGWQMVHNARHHAEKVRALAAVRRLVDACTDIVADADSALEDPRRWLDDCGSRIEAYSKPARGWRYKHIAESIAGELRAMSEAGKRRQAGEHPCGIPTPWKQLTECVYGWEPAKLYVIAARPGAGKTACALAVVEHAAAHGFPCLVLSMEMSDTELAGRAMAAESGLDRRPLKRGIVTHDQGEMLKAAGTRIARTPLYIDDTPALSIREMRARARQWKRDPRIVWGTSKLGIVAVDYLQLASASGRADNREQAIAEVSRGLKALAKELQLPVVACAQLNRETEKRTGAPILSDLRESGAIEQDADVIAFLWHPVHKRDDRGKPTKEVDRSLVEMRIAKHRDGPQGAVRFRFDGARMRFTELPP